MLRTFHTSFPLTALYAILNLSFKIPHKRTRVRDLPFAEQKSSTGGSQDLLKDSEGENHKTKQRDRRMNRKPIEKGRKIRKTE